jgi:serine/threonine-protein kinase
LTQKLFFPIIAKSQANDYSSETTTCGYILNVVGDITLAQKETNGDPAFEKLGVTSWLKLKLFGKDKKTSLVDTQFFDDFSSYKTIGRYDIAKKLGQGSMGVVYLGEDPYIKRKVAIKVARPYPDQQDDEAQKYSKRFFAEVQSVGRLLHPNIVAIHDAGLHQNFYYLAMEYINGSTLDNFCTKDNLLPVSKVVEIIFSACQALDYAHSQGVVHRDIKPSNMMLTESGDIKITDFGIAHVQTDNSYTKGVIGTPCYMSPEQITDQAVDDKTDIFSLGCVLYELLAGKKAFPGDNHFAIMYKISTLEPDSILNIRPKTPPILDKIVRKALAKDTSVRYQSCMDFAYELRVALRGLTNTVKKSKIDDVIDYVHQASFFENFTRSQVNNILKSSNLTKVPKGKILLSEGEIDDSFYIILSGKAMVRKNKKNIAVINRGECFGEMAYLAGGAREATVFAVTDCILMKISATLLEKSPESIQLLFMKRFAMTLLTRLAQKK